MALVSFDRASAAGSLEVLLAKLIELDLLQLKVDPVQQVVRARRFRLIVIEEDACIGCVLDSLDETVEGVLVDRELKVTRVGKHFAGGADVGNEWILVGRSGRRCG